MKAMGMTHDAATDGVCASQFVAVCVVVFCNVLLCVVVC